MYMIGLYIVCLLAYCAMLGLRYKTLKATFTRVDTFTRVMGQKIYVVAIFGLLAAVGVSTLVARSLPVIISTSQPSALVDLFSSQTENRVLVWVDWTEAGGIVYHVTVRDHDGSIVPYSIPAGPLNVKIIEDENLHDTGTWTVTTSKSDMSKPLARWTFNGDGRTVLKTELRVPKGTISILPH